MKKTILFVALAAFAWPLMAQQQEGYSSDSSIGGDTLAERNARRARLAAQVAAQQAQQEGDIYRGKVFGATQENYASSTLGNNRTPAKTKYVYDTSLIRAIKLGDEDRVRTLIYANVDVNERNYAGITPMTVAAEKGNMTILKYLVDAGAEINEASPFGVTPLIAAAAAGNDDVVKYLLNHGAQPDAEDETGKTPLLYTAYFDNAKLLKTFAQLTPQAIDRPDVSGNTPLIYAAQKGNNKNVKTLLTNRANPNFRNPYTGASALAVAAAEGNTSVVRTLLNYKANVNLPDNEGRTPLAYAAEAGKAEALRALLAAGATPNTPDINGVTPLMRAAAKGNDECVSSLLHRNDIRLEQKDAQGKPALIYSVYSPTLNATEMLLRKGADINAMDAANNTALMTAIAIGNAPAANYLLGEGANTFHATAEDLSTLTADRQYMPPSTTARQVTGQADREYQQALQEEAASLAYMREMEAQLAQDEENLRRLQQRAASSARSTAEQLQMQYNEGFEEIDGWKTTIRKDASAAQQQAAAQAEQARQQVMQEREKAVEAAHNTVISTTAPARTYAQTRQRALAGEQETYQKSTVQDMQTLQPRLRTMDSY